MTLQMLSRALLPGRGWTTETLLIHRNTREITCIVERGGPVDVALYNTGDGSLLRENRISTGATSWQIMYASGCYLRAKRVREEPCLLTVRWTYDDEVAATTGYDVRVFTSSSIPQEDIFTVPAYGVSDSTTAADDGVDTVFIPTGIPAGVVFPQQPQGPPMPSPHSCAECSRPLYWHEIVTWPSRPGEFLCTRCATGQWIVTKAKFPGKCIRCRKDVPVGAVIRWARGVGIRHADCSKQVELPKEKPQDRGWVEL